MQLTSSSFNNGAAIPAEFAFGKIDPVHHFAISENRNPHLGWTDVPAGTKSFVLICHDVDVPSKADDVNQEGREVPSTLPRIDFYHWLLLDIPSETREIAAGSHSSAVTQGGKPGPSAPNDLRHGINNFTDWFAGDENMKGTYHGYDGPAPPWNDSLIHHYIFTLYAIDEPHLGIKGDLTGPNVLKALEGHILAEAKLMGTYTLNPRLA